MCTCPQSSKTKASLWIYTTLIVENMQTVCEGLHVNCKIATADEFVGKWLLFVGY